MSNDRCKEAWKEAWTDSCPTVEGTPKRTTHDLSHGSTRAEGPTPEELRDQRRDQLRRLRADMKGPDR